MRSSSQQIVSYCLGLRTQNNNTKMNNYDDATKANALKTIICISHTILITGKFGFRKTNALLNLIKI